MTSYLFLLKSMELSLRISFYGGLLMIGFEGKATRTFIVASNIPGWKSLIESGKDECLYLSEFWRLCEGSSQTNGE